MNATLETFLHRLPVMAGLDDDALHVLAELAREEHFAPGAVIVAEGEAGNRVFFLAAGNVEVVKQGATSPQVRLAALAAGDFFGEMSLVESVARSASVVAVDHVTAYTLRGSDFHKLYRQRPDQYGIVILNIARDLARRLRALDARFCDLAQ